MLDRFSKIIINEDGFYHPPGNACSIYNREYGNRIPEAAHFGLASEDVIHAYEDFSGCDFECLPFDDQKTLQIACIFPGLYVTQSFFFGVISLLNQLPSERFSLYVHPDKVGYLSAFCNEHIKVLAFQREEPSNIKCNLVITYGLRVIHFMRRRMPVVVLGPDGLGGFVTQVNLHFMERNHFMGRPGGSLHEYIPIEVLAHEIGLIKDVDDIGAIVNESYTIAQQLPIKAVSEEYEIQEKRHDEVQQIYIDHERRDQLYPRLRSNMRMQLSGDSLLICRKLFGDTVCTMDKEEAGFFKEMDGKNSCADIRQKYQIEECLFWETIEILLERQIIVIDL